MGQGIAGQKAYAFALRIIKAYKILTENNKEFVLLKQMLQSETAIGTLCKETEHTQSRADFLNKNEYRTKRSE